MWLSIVLMKIRQTGIKINFHYFSSGKGTLVSDASNIVRYDVELEGGQIRKDGISISTLPFDFE